MITREQVADLRPGDVVELSWPSTNDQTVTVTMRGTVRAVDGGALWLGCTGICLRRVNGDPVYADERSLTVISRAPRPLYVNHDRTEPVPGDVVVAADGGRLMWVFRRLNYGAYHWCRVNDLIHQPRCELPPLLRLLVDGETGQVVR